MGMTGLDALQTRYPAVQPTAATMAQPSISADPASGGPMTFQQANDPAYIFQQLKAAMTRRAQAYGQPPPTDEEVQGNMHYITQPDTYSDGQVRSGWSEYWGNRFGIPGNEGAAAGDKGGDATLVPGGQRQTLSSMSQSGYGMPGGYSNQPVNGVASFNAPGLAAPYTKEFQPTDINTILDAPAFKAAQANGVDQIQRSAAARGTLLTGGTLKYLAGYTQGLALGELDKQFGRDATTYGTNRDTFYGNQNNAYNKLSGFANTGLNAAQTVGGYGTTYANNATQLATGQGDANASATLAKGTNTNQTLGSLATNLGQVDWSKLFPKKAGTPTAYPGAALPGTY